MKSCLIVDDSRTVRLLARRILEDLAFSIREAGDGRAAMEACRQNMPDAILLDWNMPGMNGMEFLKELRVSAGGDRPIVLFCTTENDLGHIQAALAAGADEYIMKPFDKEIIESKFEQAGLI